MPTLTINISLPEELVKKVDNAAKQEFASRSDYIRQALVNKLETDRVKQDDWDLLAELSDEIAASAAAGGYTSDEDFVRAVKEVRKDRLNKSQNK
jgi:Arc/MetJ-type ribon-helix-helix transcriptional regulator